MASQARFPDVLLVSGIAFVAGISVLAGQQDRPSAKVEPVTVAAADAAPGAGAYNLRITSDASPDLTDLDGLIHSTTSQWPTAREKVRALFYWTRALRRQTTPMVLHGHEVTDPIRNFADYGFTMCSTATGINQSLYERLGLQHQYWDICNHTVSQVAYDGQFHMVDSAYSNLVTKDDGVTLASVQEASAGGARLVKERSLHSTSPFGFLTGSDTLRTMLDAVAPNGSVTRGYASSFCETGLKWRNYFYNWNAGHRYVLNLRENESYVRYYRRLSSANPLPREYWVGSENINSPDPASTKQIDPTNKFGNHGNGRWTFSPSLAADNWQRATYSSSNITAGATGLQPENAAAPADVIYKVQGANAIASQSLSARFTSQSALATATLSLSVNHGLTWGDIGLVSQQTGSVPLLVNLRDQVNGFYEVLIRVRLNAGSDGTLDTIVLTALAIDTITTLNVPALPKLNIGRNEIFVGAGDQTDTMVLWPDLRGERWRMDAYDSSNIASQSVDVPREYTAVAYPAVLTQDAYLTYRMAAPREIKRVVYGGRLFNKQPGGYIDFLHSFDDGVTWTRSYRLATTSLPYDVIHYETVTNIPAGATTVRFRYLIHNAGTTAGTATGLYAARMEADYLPAAGGTAPVELTLRWKEVQANRSTIERSHKQVVDRFPSSYVVNVGGSDHPIMESLRINLPGAGDGTPIGYGDGVDAGGTKWVSTVRADGINLAKNKPYTFSAPPSGFQSSAPATNTTILTDGVVGSPVTGGIAYSWGQCWKTANKVVDLQVDLAAGQTVGAFRAHLFGYPGWDALQGQVKDTVEVLTSVDGVSFTSRGMLTTSLWRKDIPADYVLQDDGRATGWNFALTIAPVTARYVRYRLTPARDVCLSELQVLDGIASQAFGETIAPPAWANRAPTVTLTSPQSGATQPAPGTFTLSADAADPDGSIVRVEFLSNGTVIGQAASAPYTFAWQGVPAGEYTLVSRAFDAAGGSAVSSAVTVKVTSDPVRRDDIVLHAAVGPTIIGGWSVVADPTAASQARLQNPNLGAAKLTTALAMPALAFELTFEAEANRPYRLWLRGNALSNSYNNDSVFVQFDHSVNSAGTPMWRINTTDAATIVLEDCAGCGVSGWGWADTGYGANALGPVVYFESSGPQRVRVQAREDGLGIDQIVLSPSTYISAAPGRTKDDTTILPSGSRPSGSPAVDEIVLYPGLEAISVKGWVVTSDPSAAGSLRLQNPNAGAAKLTTALADPVASFDLTFNADAGKAYRLWIRGRALNDSYNNDSVFVQFDDAVDQSALPVWRLGTTSAAIVILEQCGGCGLQGWGWTDNGYEVEGLPVVFTRSGPHRLRIQVREDGLAIDQIVLSAVAYRTVAPGSAKNDTVIVAK